MNALEPSVSFPFRSDGMREKGRLVVTSTGTVECSGVFRLLLKASWRLLCTILTKCFLIVRTLLDLRTSCLAPSVWLEVNSRNSNRLAMSHYLVMLAFSTWRVITYSEYFGSALDVHLDIEFVRLSECLRSVHFTQASSLGG